MESKWQSLYQKEIKDSGGIKLFFEKKIKEKKPLLERIIKIMPAGGRILEAGCGTAVLSIYLSNLNFQVTSLDNDENMLQLARTIADMFPKKPEFIKKDLFNLDYPDNWFDLSFSHGVLEHFTENDLIKIINNQLKIAKILIFSVPTNYFKQTDKIYGDEHLLKIKEWEKIIGKTNGKIIEKFGYYFQNKIKALLYHLFKICTPPYIGFVISKK